MVFADKTADQAHRFAAGVHFPGAVVQQLAAGERGADVVDHGGLHRRDGGRRLRRIRQRRAADGEDHTVDVGGGHGHADVQLVELDGAGLPGGLAGEEHAVRRVLAAVVAPIVLGAAGGQGQRQ